MHRLLIISAFLTLAPFSHALAMEKDVEIELIKLEQMIQRSNQTSERLLKDNRTLERKNEDLKKQVNLLQAKVNQLVDDMVRVQNVDIANLKAAQKNLYDMIPLLNWGVQERPCETIKASHQQIKSIPRDDGKLTLRYLCLDGRAIHLGTEVNLAP